jgi:Na+-driven multidrug efflux pump
LNIARQVIFWASLFATWCIDIPMCYYLGLVKGLGLKALWYSIFMMEVCRFLIMQSHFVLPQRRFRIC